MKLEIFCAMCGKERPISLPLDKGEPNIRAEVEASGWIVQMNDLHFDIYCSKKCAE